jgi:hypothetical protein
LIGQRNFAALLGLSVLSSGGLLLLMPVAASHGAAAMIVAYTCAAGIAVAAATFFYGARQRRVSLVKRSEAAGPGAWEVWRFGLVQLASVIGLNAAGWWTASLVARGDRSMMQMGLYAAAIQLRNVIAIIPGLVTQSNFALLTEESGKQYGGAGRVLIACTLVATLLSVGLAGIAIATLPWTLGRMYSHAFQSAELAASLAICTALVHMAAAPAAARLTIVSLRLTGIINGVWTVLVIGLATWLVRGAGAIEATGIFLVAHCVSAVLVLVALKRLSGLPRGLLSLSMTSLAASVGFAALAYARYGVLGRRIPLSVAIFLATLGLLWIAVRLGHKSMLLPGDFVRRQIREFGAAVIGKAAFRASTN